MNSLTPQGVVQAADEALRYAIEYTRQAGRLLVVGDLLTGVPCRLGTTSDMIIVDVDPADWEAITTRLHQAGYHQIGGEAGEAISTTSHRVGCWKGTDEVGEVLVAMPVQGD